MWSHLRHTAIRLTAGLSLALSLALVSTQCWSEATNVAVGAAVVTVQVGGAPAAGGVQVRLAGTTYAAVTDGTGSATIVAPPGDYRVLVTYIGCPPVQQDVTIPVDASVAVTVTLSCGDAVKDASSPTAERIWVLDHARVGASSCVADLLVRGAGLTYLPGNATTSASDGTPCHLSALVLAREGAPSFSNVSADFPWTSALGEVYLPTMPAAKLPLAIRIIVSDPSLTNSERTALIDAIQAAELALAQSALDASFAGIQLVGPGGGPPEITSNDGVAPLLSGGCANVAGIRANPTIYSSKTLNIYYVATARNEEGAEKAGYVCATSDAPEIIFVDHDGHFASVLAHEIGHALGLMTPMWGHADYLEGFYEDADGRKLNVMVDGTPDGVESLPADARYYSVGQVARMHLVDGSWLNRPSAADGSSIRSRAGVPGAGVIDSCGCPETAATSDCPAINTDIDRSTPSVTPRGPAGFIMACSVQPQPGPFELCLGVPSTIKATLHQGSQAAQGATMWVSMNPGVLKATSVWSSSLSTMIADLTPLAVGPAILRAYADGAFAPIAVTIKPSPC